MVRKLTATDFRARRMVLEPDDFALNDGSPEPAPTNLVEKKVWHGIMDIADDVAIRNTSHQGSRIGLLYDLWGGWLEAMPEKSMVGYAMLDCSDDFAASILSLLHGFYKQAIATLRSALETMVLACACEVSGDAAGWEDWETGKQFDFARTRHRLRVTPIFMALEDRAQAAIGQTLFADRNGAYLGGWVTSLYGRLSNHIHSRGDTSNASMWKSNGPIYSAVGMMISYHSYLETYAALLLMAKAAVPTSALPSDSEVLFNYDSRKRYLRKEDRKLCAFLKREVFE